MPKFFEQGSVFAFQEGADYGMSTKRRNMKNLTSAPQSVPTDLMLRVLIKRESDGQREKWAAQCLEYDIAAQGESLSEVKNRFDKTVMGYFALAVKHKKSPFANIPPAPEEYHRMWENATALQDPLHVGLPGARVSTGARSLRSRVPRGQILLKVA
jgi:hypothetical protein